MPKTNKIARYVKEPPVLEHVTQHTNRTKRSGLYLLKLRFRHAETQSSLAKRKPAIGIESGNQAEVFSLPIKAR